MRTLTVLFLAAVLLVMNSCSRRPFDAAREEVELLRRDSEWAEAASSGKDIEKVLSYWTDDALLIFPGQPVLEGKAGRFGRRVALCRGHRQRATSRRSAKRASLK